MKLADKIDDEAGRIDAANLMNMKAASVSLVKELMTLSERNEVWKFRNEWRPTSIKQEPQNKSCSLFYTCSCDCVYDVVVARLGHEYQTILAKRVVFQVAQRYRRQA